MISAPAYQDSNGNMPFKLSPLKIYADGRPNYHQSITTVIKHSLKGAFITLSFTGNNILHRNPVFRLISTETRLMFTGYTYSPEHFVR